MEDIPAPVAKVEPKELAIHGDTRIDDYYWIRDDDRSDPEVLALLEAENAYTKAMMAHTEDLQDKLYEEITGRLTANDRTVPVRKNDYLYFREFREGGEYPIYLRRKAAPGSEEKILLNVNDLSRGYDYYRVGNWSVSSGQDIVAFAEDTVSRRQYTLRFKDLGTDRFLPDKITNVSTDIAWANDNKTVFYVAKHPETLLPYQVYRHELGTPVEEDVLVYEEKDPQFYTSVYTARSEEYVVISMRSTTSSEIRLIDASRPASEPEIFLPREADHEYRVRHAPGAFYVITNWNAENFRLMMVPETAVGDKRHWQEVVAHRSDVLLQDVEVFSGHVVLSERERGLSRLRVLSLA
ncbi:MAG: S9 family peptidase, partial [Pseudomonadales bacterium]|nr:S9 family peptidase [Pseudomonadales bacterium]